VLQRPPIIAAAAAGVTVPGGRPDVAIIAR
jgi:hypothetical protein